MLSWVYKNKNKTDRVLTNTFGYHKASSRWTWHSPNRQHYSQIDYILVRKRFRSEVNIARTWSFSGADIWSDHDLLIMTCHLRLKRISEPKHTRLKCDLEKLKDTNVLETFQAMIGGKFAPLTEHSKIFPILLPGQHAPFTCASPPWYPCDVKRQGN